MLVQLDCKQVRFAERFMKGSSMNSACNSPFSKLLAYKCIGKVSVDMFSLEC